MLRLLAAFLRLPWRKRALAVEASLWLALARLFVGRVPMRYWRLDAGAGAVGGASRSAPAVGWAVRRVADRLPFEAKCLPRALAAHWMLRRRGGASRVVFGVRRTAPERRPEYHAWLVMDGETVIGGRQAASFTPLPASVPPAAPDC
jgi:hypothetical protein